MKEKVRITAMASAATTALQIPSTPQIRGKVSTANISKTRVRRKEIRAEIKPLLRAVKKLDLHVVIRLCEHAL